jgi:site-specific recombinase XerD
MKVKRVINWRDIDMSQLELEKLVIHYAQSNKAEGKSPKTVSWYTEMLSCFIKYTKDYYDDASLSSLNVINIRQFIISEQSKGLSPYTVQGKVRALKAFSSWLFSEGYTTDNLLTNVRPPKAPVKIIDILTVAEIDKLINVQNPLTALGSRNTAILITLLDTGIRLSELCNLSLENSFIEDGYIKVTGKGNKERIVPVGAQAQKVIWRYVYHFRPEPASCNDGYLFLTIDGQHLQPNAVKLILRRWAKKAGVPRMHAHLCRHTFATNFLIYQCGDVFRLQQILGHTSLEMVRRYVHYAETQAMIRGRISSPLDHLGIKRLRGYKIDRILKNGRG